MRELHKLDDLDPDKQGYLTALNVYNSSDMLDIVNLQRKTSYGRYF